MSIHVFETGAALDRRHARIEYARRRAPGDARHGSLRHVLFSCATRLDPDTLLQGFVEAGGIERTAPGDLDYRLTPLGRDATFLVVGCLHEGPGNLRRLARLQRLLDLGAGLTCLADNHDIRTYLALRHAGRSETHLQHLLVRMSNTLLPLLREVRDDIARTAQGLPLPIDDAEARRRLLPGDRWYADFRREAATVLAPRRLQRELERVRAKSQALELACRDIGLSLGELHATIEHARQSLFSPRGGLRGYFERTRLTHREGSSLFMRAAMDDTLARHLRRGGVAAVEACYRRLLDGDLFELYQGPLCDAYRTKDRDHRVALTSQGARDLHAAGIRALLRGPGDVLEGRCPPLRATADEDGAPLRSSVRRLQRLDGRAGATMPVEPRVCPPARAAASARPSGSSV